MAYVRKLKLLGVGVQFEKEGISTLSMGDEMLLNTFSALAQEESQSISMNQRLSIVKRMELGEYVDSNAPYGYRLVDKMLAVYEPEAVIVRNIFTLYLQGFSTSEIARELNKLNIPTKSGKETWRPSRVAYILRNERYIGDSFYQKTYRETTVPFNQHTNRGQEDRFYAKGTHPGIVDKNVFDAVQTLIEKRKGVFAKATTQNIYPLTSRIQCSECGSFYRRRIVSGTVKWVCSLHKDDSTACSSNYYSEERIYDGFISMVNKLRFSEDNILGQVISRLEMTLAAMKRNNMAARDLSKSIAESNARLLMSTSYFIFTEVQVNGQWYCINPKVMRLLPIKHLIVVPTLRSDARYQFEKAYRQLEHDGCPFTVDEMSENLQASVTDWLAPEDSVRIAVYYDDILKMLNASGKEHSAFALRSEIAAFQNDESDDIWDFVSVDEYRKMDDELKKAYQYFEWNDRSGAYRYYEEIQKKVSSQVRDWKAINPRDGISSIRILLFSV